MPDTYLYFGIFLVVCLGYIAGYTHRFLLDRYTITKLRKHNSELMKELAEGTTVERSQLAEYKRVVQEHLKLNEEQNNITVYIRNNFPEILDGRFSSFSQMVIGLLKRPHTNQGIIR